MEILNDARYEPWNPATHGVEHKSDFFEGMAFIPKFLPDGSINKEWEDAAYGVILDKDGNMIIHPLHATQ